MLLVLRVLLVLLLVLRRRRLLVPSTLPLSLPLPLSLSWRRWHILPLYRALQIEPVLLPVAIPLRRCQAWVLKARVQTCIKAKLVEVSPLGLGLRLAALPLVEPRHPRR